jgi:hypothetical protein
MAKAKGFYMIDAPMFKTVPLLVMHKYILESLQGNLFCVNCEARQPWKRNPITVQPASTIRQAPSMIVPN